MLPAMNDERAAIRKYHCQYLHWRRCRCSPYQNESLPCWRCQFGCCARYTLEHPILF